MCLYILSLSSPSLSQSSKDTETRPLGAGAENLEEALHLPSRKLWVEEKKRDSPPCLLYSHAPMQNLDLVLLLDK